MGSVLLSYGSGAARAAGAASPSLGVSDRWARRIRDEADESILESLTTVPPSERRSLFRRIVEEIEQVHGDGAGSGVWRLFCVPLVIAFEDSMPASQVDAALLPLLDGRGRLPLNRAPTTVDDTIAFVATVFEADDLADLPLSVVRRGALDLLSLRFALPAKHPFVQRRRPQHRLRMFLRCLVGLRRLDVDRIAEQRQQIDGEIRSQLAELGGSVRVWCDGSFHDALYSGLWAYQARRLAVATSEAAGSYVEANVTAEGTDLRPTLRIRFSARAGREPAVEYRLRCRPFEDCDRARRRVEVIIAHNDPGVVLR